MKMDERIVELLEEGVFDCQNRYGFYESEYRTCILHLIKVDEETDLDLCDYLQSELPKQEVE